MGSGSEPYLAWTVTSGSAVAVEVEMPLEVTTTKEVGCDSVDLGWLLCGCEFEFCGVVGEVGRDGSDGRGDPPKVAPTNGPEGSKFAGSKFLLPGVHSSDVP
jgi:hypothetical protein